MVPLARLSVKQATHQQLGGICIKREDRFSAFVSLGNQLPEGHEATHEEVTAFKLLLRKAGRLPVENRQKDAYWRLVMDGVHGKHVPGACGYGELDQGRAHVYWGCKVARGVCFRSCKSCWRPPPLVIC